MRVCLYQATVMCISPCLTQCDGWKYSWNLNHVSDGKLQTYKCSQLNNHLAAGTDSNNTKSSARQLKHFAVLNLLSDSTGCQTLSWCHTQTLMEEFMNMKPSQSSSSSESQSCPEGLDTALTDIFSGVLAP